MSLPTPLEIPNTDLIALLYTSFDTSMSLTEPNTPVIEGTFGNDGDNNNPSSPDFARLIPVSAEAKIAFHELAQQIQKLENDVYQWHSRFIHIRTRLTQVHSRMRLTAPTLAVCRLVFRKHPRY